MPSSIANYSTTSGIPLDEDPLATVKVSHIERFKSASLFVLVDNLYFVAPSLNSRIFKLFREFESLGDNWDEDDAKAPDPRAISQARYVSLLLDNIGQPIYHAAPGPNGEVMLDLRNRIKSRSVELIFYPNRGVVVFFPEREAPYQETFDYNGLPEILEWLNQI